MRGWGTTATEGYSVPLSRGGWHLGTRSVTVYTRVRLVEQALNLIDWRITAFKQPVLSTTPRGRASGEADLIWLGTVRVSQQRRRKHRSCGEKSLAVQISQKSDRIKSHRGIRLQRKWTEVGPSNQDQQEVNRSHVVSLFTRACRHVVSK